MAAAIAAGRHRRLFPDETSVGIDGIDNAFAVALHMHQPLILAGGPDLRTAATISNLQWMLEPPDAGDSHNAPVFHWCYKRMGELIPQLLGEGSQPRIMLEGTVASGYHSNRRPPPESLNAIGDARIDCFEHF